MAYFSMHAYDADVWAREFKGLNQADVSLNPDPRYAAEEENLETPHGVLQPRAAYEIMKTADGNSIAFDGVNLPQGRIETLCRLHRRIYDNTGSQDWFVCCVNGLFYYRQADSIYSWAQITMPTEPLITRFKKSVWSWVTYEDSYTAVDPPVTVDVLVLSNEEDGMIEIIPPDKNTTWGEVGQNTWGAVKGSTSPYHTWNYWYRNMEWVIRIVSTEGYKFGTIARYAERIWGGNVAGHPDLMVYSKAYAPRDWTPDSDPEASAGEISQPSWDGEKFTAMVPFGDQLIAFKERRAWRIMGVYPGQYTFAQQFGGGTPYMNTVAVDVDRIFMADDLGISVYDGTSTTPYARAMVEKIWPRVNNAAMSQMCAVFFQKKYYLALPVDGSDVNNALLVYDMEEGSILFHKDIYIESFLDFGDRLYATSSSLPGEVLEVAKDSWISGRACGSATKWVSPWMDFGYKRIAKGGFDLYFIPEVQDEAVTLKFSMQTEKKLKSKTYTVQPLTEAQRAAEKEHRGKRLHFSGTGRKFRFIIETEDGVTAPWRLVGGLQIVVETDPD